MPDDVEGSIIPFMGELFIYLFKSHILNDKHVKSIFFTFLEAESIIFRFHKVSF